MAVIGRISWHGIVNKAQLGNLAAAGKRVIIISCELSELLTACDRIRSWPTSVRIKPQSVRN
jgi:ABC-type uncharacterized transport system ATPase subunit